MSAEIALIIEDTDANRDFFERLLAQAGYRVICAQTGQAAMSAVADIELLALAVIDMQMPDMSGLQLTAWLRGRYPDACLVVATMHDESTVVASAFAKGCDVFLVKPHGFIELFNRLKAGGAAGLRATGPLIIDQYGPRPFV